MDYIETWLKGLSKRTKINYRKEFEKWLHFINMTPEQQIQKRLEDTACTNQITRQFFENKFRAYKEHMENNTKLSALSIKTMLRTVASFFARNGLPLNLKSGDWKSTKETKVIQRFKLKNEDVKAMYGHGNLRDRALLLTLYQSGLSEIDVSELKVEDIKDIYNLAENEHYFFEKPREKTNIIQATCLSYECLHDVRAMLTERGSPEKGFIFASQTRTKGKTKKERNKSKGSQIETRRVNEAMKTLAEKTFGPEKARLFKTKALRSAYNSALLRADLKPECKDLMMGHERQSARKAYDYDEQMIKEAYSKAFEYLSINGIQTREDMKELRQTLTQEIDTLTKILVSLIPQEKLNELKASIGHVAGTEPTAKEILKGFAQDLKRLSENKQ
jgi:site-specific recombinase XerD